MRSLLNPRRRSLRGDQLLRPFRRGRLSLSATRRSGCVPDGGGLHRSHRGGFGIVARVSFGNRLQREAVTRAREPDHDGHSVTAPTSTAGSRAPARIAWALAITACRRHNGESDRSSSGACARTLRQSEQGFEMLGLALHVLAELRRHSERADAVSRILANPRAGYVGVAGAVVVLLLPRPVVVLNGKPASLLDRVGFVCALAVDRKPVGGFDREVGHDDLQNPLKQNVAWLAAGAETSSPMSRRNLPGSRPISLASTCGTERKNWPEAFGRRGGTDIGGQCPQRGAHAAVRSFEG